MIEEFKYSSLLVWPSSLLPNCSKSFYSLIMDMRIDLFIPLLTSLWKFYLFHAINNYSYGDNNDY